MNAAQCRQQALNQIRFPAEFDRYVALDAVVRDWMAPYLHRDASMDPGIVLVDEVDPETFEHRTVEKQLHQARQVRPFVFGPSEVQDLARHIRRELRLR